MARSGGGEVHSALSRRRRAVPLLAVAAMAAGLGVIAYATHLLRRPELQTIDARFDIRGSEPHRTAGVAIVAIDDTTFNDFRHQKLHARWPFPRRYEARVIENLHRTGAKVIAVDIQFTEASDAADDEALAEAVAGAHNVVLSTTEVGPHGTTNVLGGDAVLRELGARAGDTEIINDSDGVIRRMVYSLSGLKTLPVASAEVATGRAVPARSSAARGDACRSTTRAPRE